MKPWAASGPAWPAAQVLAELEATGHPAASGIDELATIRRTDRGATLRGRRRGQDWAVVVKLFADAEGFERARRLCDHHRHAWERCRAEADARIPEPIAAFAGLPGYAMRHVRGRSASSIVKWTLAGRARTREVFLARAARWLRAYHRACDRQVSRVSPGYLVRELDARFAARETAVTGRHAPDFQAAAEILREGARRIGPFDFPKALMHGDFNFHNLVIDGAATWAIDFSGGVGNIRPVTFDVACCLFYLEFRDGWTGEDRAGTPGGFDRRALEIFAAGYPDLPWDSAEAAWLLLHHQLRQWTSFERLNLQRRSGRMAAICRAAAATLAARLGRA